MERLFVACVNDSILSACLLWRSVEAFQEVCWIKVRAAGLTVSVCDKSNEITHIVAQRVTCLGV